MLRLCRITCQRVMLLALLLTAPYTAARGAEPPRQTTTSPTKIQGTIMDIQSDCIVVQTSTASIG